MITSQPIVNGRTYLGNHLRKNDYWKEGEKQVEGYWFGEGAKRLELEKLEFDLAFEQLRKNINPLTQKPLTPRMKDNRVAFHDIQLSAPKDVSTLAIVGQDARVVAAFRESVNLALKEMERYAAVRERRGAKAYGDEFRLTGEMISAVFHHDSSRQLDPQLHAHAVTANATFDKERGKWMALQPAEMLRASKFVRQVLYHDLSQRLNKLGYETYRHNPDGFAVRGVEHLRERFSKRTAEVETAIKQFQEVHKREPTKKEVDVMVKQTRGNKLTEISTPAVRQLQTSQLSDSEKKDLEKLVSQAKSNNSHSPTLSQKDTEAILQKGLDHIFERVSVAREGEVLAAAVELADGQVNSSQLRKALQSHSDVIANEKTGEISLKSILQEEQKSLNFAKQGFNTCFTLGDLSALQQKLKEAEKEFKVSQEEPLSVGEKLVQSKDKVTVLIGDAGTGKTFLLKTVRDAHLAGGGKDWIALAPTGRARDELKANGFSEAETVQRFLVDTQKQQTAKGRVLLVDEAGMLSTQQMADLFQIATKTGNRVILVGDTKQHESVERGNALRNLIEGAKLPIAQLTSVRRQKSPEQKQIAETLAKGQMLKGLKMADKAGMVTENSDEKKLVTMTAEAYVQNLQNNRETIVVCPVWSEIEMFNQEARALLKQKGIIKGEEIERKSVTSLSWTEAQKTTWSQYREGMTLTFHKSTVVAEKGENLEVIKIEKNGVTCRKANGEMVKVTQKQKRAFDVGKNQTIKVAAGDKILLRGNCPALGLNNGETILVERVDAETKSLWLKGNKQLLADFQQFSYGHAVTSHKSQGASVSESFLLMGNKSSQIANARQWYVSNTRYKERHQIFVVNKEQLAQTLAKGTKERELAWEYFNRAGESKEFRLIDLPRQIWKRLTNQLQTHKRKWKQFKVYQFKKMKRLGNDRERRKHKV